jgi:flagellar biosynthesis protein FlhG
VQDRRDRIEDLQVVRTGGLESGRLRRPQTRTIAFVSGKGGVGKTTLVANLALALRRRGLNVLLVDGDWGMASVDLLLGIVPQSTLHDVVLGVRSSKDVLLQTEDGIYLLPGASGVQEMTDLDDLRCERLLCSISDAEAAMDLILIDTSSGIHRTTMHLARAADEIIIVTTPEPTATHNAYAALKVLCDGHLHCAPRIIVNQAQSAQEAREVAERLRAAARRFLSIDSQFLGYVPEDPAVMTSIRRRQPVLRLFPNAPGAVCIERLAARLSDHPEPEPQAVPNPDELRKVVNLEDAPA